jgi:hypothetical protein
MTPKSSKMPFWTGLTIMNILAMIYPVRAYIQAETSEAQLFGAIAMVGAAFLLAITDTVSVIIAYMR